MGLGGYAAQHHRALPNLEAKGVCRVVATCDPILDSPTVPTYRSLEELLAKHEDLDLVTLPVPVPLHAPMHRLVVEAGIACYLEKPPTLWWPEYEAMCEVEKRAARPTQVGFNFIGDPFRQALKRRIDSGEFGSLIEASLLAIWPRDAAYYGRNGWAGRLALNGSPVLDCPLGNALAHYVQNLLFFADNAGIASLRASLRRAHPIESYDTAFIEAQLATGATLRFAASHANLGRSFQRETFRFERTTIVFEDWNRARIEGPDGIEGLRSETSDQLVLLQNNLAHYLDGQAAIPLAQCGPFVSLIDLAFVGSGRIERFEEIRLVRGDGTVDVVGLADELAAFAAKGAWPGEVPTPVGPEALSRLPEWLSTATSELPA